MQISFLISSICELNPTTVGATMYIPKFNAITDNPKHVVTIISSIYQKDEDTSTSTIQV
jgi:hypothetical protein